MEKDEETAILWDDGADDDGNHIYLIGANRVPGRVFALYI